MNSLEKKGCVHIVSANSIYFFQEDKVFQYIVSKQ